MPDRAPPAAPPWWLVLVALALSVAITLDVHFQGPLAHLDRRIADRMAEWDLRHDAVPRALLTLLLYFGQRGVVLTLAVALAAWLAWRHRTLEPAVRLVVALVLIAAVIYAFKYGMPRTAPLGVAQGRPLNDGESYPSGHVANAVVLWGWAQWCVARWSVPSALRRAIVIGRWIAPLAVAIGMTLLNYHWLSDYLGAAAMGIVLLAITLAPGWTRPAEWLDGRSGLRSVATP
jgi:hypothetical protein